MANLLLERQPRSQKLQCPFTGGSGAGPIGRSSATSLTSSQYFSSLKWQRSSPHVLIDGATGAGPYSSPKDDKPVEGAGAEIRKNREEDLSASKEKFPLRDCSRRGNAYERRVKHHAAKPPWLLIMALVFTGPIQADRGRRRRQCPKTEPNRVPSASPTGNSSGSRDHRASAPSHPNSSRLRIRYSLR